MGVGGVGGVGRRTRSKSRRSRSSRCNRNSRGSRSSRSSSSSRSSRRISGASFCICGWGERSEPRPYIQRLARGALKGGLKVGKVLFIFPSWYLFAIGLEPVFGFR